MNVKLFFASIILVVIANLNLNAQSFHRCYTDEYMHALNQQYPGLKDATDATFEAAKNYARNKNQKSLGNWDTIFRMPVVFHVVYNTPQENISDALLHSQIEVLNEDFRRLNADTTNTRGIFQSRAGDVGFEFYLATLDPDGNPTNGINRVPTTVNQFSFFNIDDVKNSATGGADSWGAHDYINVWIGDFGGLVLGFAYPPTNAPNWDAGIVPSDEGTWGIALHYEVVGKNNPLAVGQLSIANQGRTLVHEMGHFWGLRHIWGDAGGFLGGVDCDTNLDDGIDDTPHMGSNSQIEGCDFSKNTCTFESPDEPDMVENYMDYSTEVCQNMFTDGQVAIMRSMAVIGRPGLAFILSDDQFNIEAGDYIVVNGTDTIIIDGNTNYTINTGDEVLFVHENNGYHYTATSDITIAQGSTVDVTKDGEIVGGTTSIKNTVLNNISIYPNPTKGIIQIETGEQTFDQIVVCDVQGKVLHNVMQTNTQTLDLNILDNGLYLIGFYKNNTFLGTKKVTLMQ